MVSTLAHLLDPLSSLSYNLPALAHTPFFKNQIWNHQKYMHLRQMLQVWLCLAIHIIKVILLLTLVYYYYYYEYSNCT